MATKYIFVTGGVVSGLGKGITAASLGRLLKCRGLKVASQKLDPYVNVDPGTMSPLQHGEVFVTDDGTETDLDLGHYERFIDENLNKYSNLTTGKVYWNVLNKERQGAYLGQTVQIIPHITNEIKSYIYNLAKSTEADVVITEIGGTTGDIESQPFLEAIRQVGIEQGHENCCYIHVVLVPYISGSNEYKSKPAQHSVKELQGMGIAPDIIILRADGSVGSEIRRKVSTFCNVKPECVIENLTMPSLYQCPLMLHSNGLDEVVVQKLQLDVPPADLTEWKEVVARIAGRSRTCTIALVGKYVKLHDAYLSVAEALTHGGIENDVKVDIRWVDSETLTDDNAFRMDYRVSSDADTLVNLTNHSYFNLDGGGNVLGQKLRIYASRYLEGNEQTCPTGRILPVEGTPMDLREGLPIGQRVDEDFPQLTMAGGYDHNWCIDGSDGSLRLAARAWSKETGVVMETWTPQPGVQFYSGNYLDGCPAGKGGAPYAKRWGFCLETQNFPDAPNHENFPSAVLKPGQEYKEETVYKFV